MNDQDLQDNQGDAFSHFVRLLREVRRMPVSFIQADEEPGGIEPKIGNDIEATLDALIAQAPIYRWSNVSGHYVLYSRDPIWDAEVDGIEIINLPRLEAGTQLVTQLRTKAPELGSLSEPPMMGDPRSPVYTEIVSLPRNGSILQHLVALLGTDLQTVFTVERTLFGDRVLHFGRVPE
jgi:hypothetical protein